METKALKAKMRSEAKMRDAAGRLISAVLDKSSAQTGAGALPKRMPIATTAIRAFEKQS